MDFLEILFRAAQIVQGVPINQVVPFFYGIHNKITGRDKTGQRVYHTGSEHETNWYVKNECGSQCY
jgi:hypothetical protein